MYFRKKVNFRIDLTNEVTWLFLKSYKDEIIEEFCTYVKKDTFYLYYSFVPQFVCLQNFNVGFIHLLCMNDYCFKIDVFQIFSVALCFLILGYFDCVSYVIINIFLFRSHNLFSFSYYTTFLVSYFNIFKNVALGRRLINIEQQDSFDVISSRINDV